MSSVFKQNIVSTRTLRESRLGFFEVAIGLVVDHTLGTGRGDCSFPSWRPSRSANKASGSNSHLNRC